MSARYAPLLIEGSMMSLTSLLEGNIMSSSKENS